MPWCILLWQTHWKNTTASAEKGQVITHQCIQIPCRPKKQPLIYSDTEFPSTARFSSCSPHHIHNTAWYPLDMFQQQHQQIQSLEQVGICLQTENPWIRAAYTSTLLTVAFQYLSVLSIPDHWQSSVRCLDPNSAPSKRAEVAEVEESIFKRFT